MLKIFQTADGKKYKKMIDITSPLNKIYATLHNYEYENFIGLKMGKAPVHAAYNRVFQLKYYLDSGFNDWILYLDADAYVCNFTFDLKSFLNENSNYCFIAERANEFNDQVWAINAGVFLINLAHPAGKALITLYYDLVMAKVPETYWNNENSDWAPAEYDDQNLLYSVLNAISVHGNFVKNEKSGLFNYKGGQFIKQRLRAEFNSFEERLEAIERDTKSTYFKFIDKLNKLYIEG